MKNYKSEKDIQKDIEKIEKIIGFELIFWQPLRVLDKKKNEIKILYEIEKKDYNELEIKQIKFAARKIGFKTKKGNSFGNIPEKIFTLIDNLK